MDRSIAKARDGEVQGEGCISASVRASELSTLGVHLRVSVLLSSPPQDEGVSFWGTLLIIRTGLCPRPSPEMKYFHTLYIYNHPQKYMFIAGFEVEA